MRESDHLFIFILVYECMRCFTGFWTIHHFIYISPNYSINHLKMGCMAELGCVWILVRTRIGEPARKLSLGWTSYLCYLWLWHFLSRSQMYSRGVYTCSCRECLGRTWLAQYRDSFLVNSLMCIWPRIQTYPSLSLMVVLREKNPYFDLIII